MPTTIETTVYQFDELTDDAKEKAREWYRQGYECDADFIRDDFASICKILGVSLATRTVKLYGGGTRQEPQIWFNVGFSQGDGASFDGSYSYAKGAAKAIRKHAPKDTALHAIADRLQEAQRLNFYALNALISSHRDTSIRVFVERDSPSYQDMTDGAEDEVREAFESLADWLYRAVRNEIEYQNANEQIDESIRANEYTFDEEGHPLCLGA